MHATFAYNRRTTLAGSMIIAFRSAKTLSTAMPRIRNGNKNSQMIG